jgi:hypothetical protein
MAEIDAPPEGGRRMNISSIGAVLAIIAIVLAIVFAAIGQLTVLVAGLVVLLGIARLT